MIKREISEHIQTLMTQYFAVTVFGPRQCGKTTLAKSLFCNFSYANLEDMNTRLLAKDDPEEFFTRFPEPVIIDEIQRVPELLSAVQVRIDGTISHYRQPANFIKKLCFSVVGRTNCNSSNAATFNA